MASVRNDITIDAPADAVWAALADFQAVHRRVAPGFLTDSTPDGEGVRVVTFSNGTSARETLVALDAVRRRLAYAIIGGRAAHYNASVQVIPEDAERCRVEWIIDLMPDALADYVRGQTRLAVADMARTLGRVS
ncbi:MAG: SRPBCC family protein [Reyranellaceae bacterium]